MEQGETDSQIASKETEMESAGSGVCCTVGAATRYYFKFQSRSQVSEGTVANMSR